MNEPPTKRFVPAATSAVTLGSLLLLFGSRVGFQGGITVPLLAVSFTNPLRFVLPMFVKTPPTITSLPKTTIELIPLNREGDHFGSGFHSASAIFVFATVESFASPFRLWPPIRPKR